ncbi:MAG: PIN domain-containing protein [Verrucomicrobia bacterium]|nr:MAG: PIN domain-containing protein [Verrucomicrobiota bacterium]
MTHGLDTSFLVAVEVSSHAEHANCRTRFQRLLKAEDTFSLAPQILAEFIHIVTDPRRFSSPLTLEQAIGRAEIWWNAAEVVHAFPTAESTLLFLGWLEEHKLGRKRLLDTMLASTLQASGVTSLLTLNRDDFVVFGGFTFPK